MEYEELGGEEVEVSYERARVRKDDGANECMSTPRLYIERE